MSDSSGLDKVVAEQERQEREWYGADYEYIKDLKQGAAIANEVFTQDELEEYANNQRREKAIERLIQENEGCASSQ